MRRARVLALAVAVCAVAPCTADAGAPSAASLAQGLFEQAREDMKQGRYGDAYPKLMESQRLDPSIGTTLNLVLCEEGLGKVASAWARARGLVDVLPDGDARKAIAERKLDGLSKRLPRLVVRLPAAPPEGMRVTMDGIELGASSLGVELPVDPGPHTFVVQAPGRSDRSDTISLGEAQEVEWTPSPGVPDGAPALHAPRESLAPIAGSGPEPASRIPAWTAIGVGAAGFIAGGILAALALDRRSTVLSQCPSKHCQSAGGVTAGNEGEAFFVGSMVALGAGGVGTGLGAYLLWHRGPSESETEPASLATRGVVVSYGGRF